MSSAKAYRWEGEPAATWERSWCVPLVEAYASVGSTSDRALELARGGAEPFTVVVADEQTRGRGRRGATWHSPPGSGLWLSTVLPAAAEARWLPLVVGLAVAEAIERAADGARVGIKWPNDLVLDGLKVGGVLCEAADGVVVAGIGINVRRPPGGFPGELGRSATALDIMGLECSSRSDLAGLILGRLEGRLRDAPSGLDDATLAALRARDVLCGRLVRTDQAGPGTARGIERDGALLVERPDGSRVSVSSGSVRAT